MVLSPARRRSLREKVLKSYDPDQKIPDSNSLFGLPFGLTESELVILPVPWDVTHVNDGAADAPDAVLEASTEISLYRDYLKDSWKKGIYMQNIPLKWKESSYELRKIRNRIKKNNAKKLSETKKNEHLRDCRNVNNTCRLLNEWVESKCCDYLKLDKIVGLLGGDQSISSGCLRALAKKYNSFGILHLDAHSDLRSSIDGLEYTDFSSMWWALKIPEIEKICLFDIRESTYSEKEIMSKEIRRISVFSDFDIKEKQLRGVTWKMIVNEVLSLLPGNIYISLDIDVLTQWHGTGVAFPETGGLTYEEIRSLLYEIKKCKKKIIGFDLCGIRPLKERNWEAKLGASLLFDLASFCLESNFGED